MATTVSPSSSGSGIDVQGTVDQLMTVERQPETQMKNQQSTLNTQASAIGTINNALSSLQSSVQVLTDFSSQLNSRTVTSSNNSLVSATADGTALIANHQIVVNNLATTSSFFTNTLKTSSTAVGQGSFDIQVNGVKTGSITVDSTNNTLDGIAAAINKANAGVTASVITDTKGARLSILSSTSGAAGEVSIANNTTTLTFNEAIIGKDASLQVDGIDLSSASNTVKGAITGVTLNLQGADPNSTISLGVAPDASQASAAINSFVTNYNTAIQQVNAQFVYDPTTKFSQPLAGDSTLQVVQQQLYSAISYSTPDGNNGISSLASLGITVNNDGTLTVDSTKLSSALSTQNADVQNFFQTASTGFAQNLNKTLSSMTDPTQGALQVELTNINSNVSSLTAQIADFETRMSQRETDLINQYSQINGTLEQMPTILAQINSQLGSL
ncbi:MAG TPA: flagellar filament capping protein FliD [Candidatus Angelobacter sp.]|nr:flagellar filament capping protein FliD [Candidatus Angelobacter sp.]